MLAEGLNDGSVDEVGVGSVRIWEVAHRLPVDIAQAVWGMAFLQRTLHRSGVLAAPGIVVRGGGGGPIRAWLRVANAGTGASTPSLSRLIKAAVPWLGLADEPIEGALPGIDPAAGLVFTAYESEGTGRVTPTGSVLWRMLGDAPDVWQLTVSAGAADPDEALVDLGLSLVGSGDDLAFVAPLLEADALHDEEIGLRHRFVGGAELDEVVELALDGRAPSVGLVPATVPARLLALPARVAGEWNVVDTPPRPAESIAETVRNAVPPHVVVQGGSGLGKTTLLDGLIADSVDAGATVVVVCPHGDLAARAATRLVGLGVEVDGVDFGDPEPVRWNLTVPDEGVDPEEHATLLTSVIRDLWPEMPADYFGPVWIRVFRAAVAVLVRDPAGPWPITYLPEVMNREASFWREALGRIGDPKLTAVIARELHPMLYAKDPGNAAAWLVSKVDPMIGDPTMRAVVGFRRGTFDVAPVLHGRSMVVSVPERRLSPDGARLLGAMVLGRIWRLVQRRDVTSPIHLYVDEWQKLPIPDLGAMLAEGRKFGLSLRLANQNTAQIPWKLWESATGNAGAILSFRTGPRDAERLAPLYTDIGCAQLNRLPDHWVAVSAGSADFVAPAPAPSGVEDGGEALRALHRIQIDRALPEEPPATLDDLADEGIPLDDGVPSDGGEEDALDSDMIGRWLRVGAARLAARENASQPDDDDSDPSAPSPDATIRPAIQRSLFDDD
ncbi:hypothetical protein BH24ACT7_BH24ACT7_14340 [soil metagenome]